MGRRAHATHISSSSTCYRINGCLRVALPRQDKLLHRFLRICSTPHTLTSALMCSSTIDTTSAFTPHTLDNSRRSITWLLELGSPDSLVCVKKKSEDIDLASCPRISSNGTHAARDILEYPRLIVELPCASGICTCSCDDPMISTRTRHPRPSFKSKSCE